MALKAPIYEQLPDEPDSSYAHFLYYKNLGPGRSLRIAYNKYLIDKGEAPAGTKCGSWGAESSDWDWVERARAFDISILENDGKDTVLAFLDALRHASAKAAEYIRLAGPESWGDALETLNVVGKFIPPETVAAISANAEADRCEDDGEAGEVREVQDGPGRLCQGSPEGNGDGGSGNDSPEPDQAAIQDAG